MFTTIETDAREKKQISIELNALLLDLFNELKEIEKNILIRRFGLLKHKCETLEQIGNNIGVTRERIRQIEQGSIQKLQQIYSQHEKLRIFKNIILNILEEYGGLMRQEHFLNVLFNCINSINNTSDNAQPIFFILTKIFNTPNLLKNHPEFHNSWYLSDVHINRAREIIDELEKKILERDKVLDEIALAKILDEINVDKKPFDAYLNATRKIEQNIFGQWGIASWPTVAPKRISDKAYLVFQQINKPLHFKEVAVRINQSDFADKKIANSGTVHNELIIDERYVLIGRGIYALKEWGFAPGTVSDLIVKLLKENGPMLRDEIVERVSKQRFVNNNTIKVALIDKNLFKKVGKNVYGLAEGGQD